MSKSQKYIGVYIENKYYFLVSFCGIILSGNIIVPLNVSDGIERTKRIITDCKIDTIITEKSLIDIVKKFNYTKKVVVMDDKNNFLRKEQNKVIIPFDASNIGTFYSKEREIKDSIKNYLYAVYTSGSTGKPKGIKVNSHNVMHLFEWIKKNFCISEKTVSYQHLSLSFDFGLKEIFNVIMNGGKLVLGTKEEKYSPQKMLEKINNKKVNMLYTTPTMFKELVSIKKKLSTLKLICLGGEALEYSILQNSKFFLNNGVSIFNGYGPTEASINALMYKVNLESYEINKNLSKGVPIGTPSGKNIVLLLDENSNPLPPGIIGEIYIGGPGVTDGYINDEDLTKKSFSIIKVNNNKINSYKTGDLAIYNSQNDLVFMGRKDSQVKIRGNRVGLIEIENALNISPHVLDCVVTYSQKLIAYLVLDQDLRYIRTQINRYLREELPNYMIPDLLIQIPNIPKNSNGKIDRKQLLKYNIEVDNVKYQKIANNDTEQRILECWEKVLGKGSVKSVDDNFFEIGGHSLNAYKLQNELEHEFKRKFNILEMFSYVTIRTFSNQLIRKKSNQISIDNRKLNKKKQITLLKKRRRQ